MEFTSDHIYKDRLIDLTVIDVPNIKLPMVHLIVEDMNGDVNLLFLKQEKFRKIFKVILYWAVIPGSARRGSFPNRSSNKLENVKCRLEDREARKNPKSTQVGERFAQVPLELSLAQVSSREESEGLGFGQQVDWLSNHKYNKSAIGNR
ncbi:unnamed protein product [Orchesella dallaii]|uniref:Uncharacterized protein n=1 Tax=Orchesella dallaii TaxID=48710 RepID=A0ABP1PWP9_9HEXA